VCHTCFMSSAHLIELAVGGLAIGCIYSLIALGFTMIIRATGVLHFAQGEVVMLGAMFGLTAF
jgi:branched-chain amino acid transport system permease protein